MRRDMTDGGDTALGGTGRTFPTTAWSDVLAAGDVSSPNHRAKLELLLRTYWRPAYVYVRTAWRKPVEEAKDLTQSFFTLLLEKGYVSRVRPDRGHFRGYLLAALKHFLINAEEADSIRRPEGRLFSIHAAPQELELAADPPASDADAAFDAEWFRVLFGDATATLRECLLADDKSRYWDVFRLYCLEPDAGGATYGDVAMKLALKSSDVMNYLTHCRRLLRLILRERIRQYVERDEDIWPELERVLKG
jgi:RNA polymerase sigma-70 factor (ECF subfamily)